MALQFHPLLPLLALLLGLSTASRKMSIAALALCVGAFALTLHRCPNILLPQEKISGTGIFHIEQIRSTSSPFQKSILYQGTLKTFTSNQSQVWNNLPCLLFLPANSKKLLESSDYEMQGRLIQKDKRTFVFKPEKKKRPLPSGCNFAKWRFGWKEKIAAYLKREITNPSARTFLTALTIGEVDERMLSMEFAKLGLQHLLAISGFHFALVALFFRALLRLFLPYHVSLICVLIGLTFYAFFLGNTPSIQRAYLTISLITIGSLFSLKSSGLNIAGACMLFELLIHPLAATQLSFQLTFLCTFAILLFYPPMEHLLQFLLPKRPYTQTRNFSFLDKHGCILSAFLRKSLSLNLAVHLLSLPVILYLFHKFPLLSLAYNLFFPFLVILSMLLLFLGCLFFFIPFFSHAIHALNNQWTSAILQWTSEPPVALDFHLRTQSISLSALICFLVGSFCVAVLFRENLLKKNLSL